MTITKLNTSHLLVFLNFFVVTTLTLGIILPSDTSFNPLLSSYAGELMLLSLSIGFVGFVLRNGSIILINFLACIALCSFLKEANSQQLAHFNSIDDTKISVAHLVLDDEESIAELEREFKNLDVDFLSIQTPIQPTLEKQLTKELSKQLPYWEKTVCNNSLTMFVFSAYELHDLDTLYYNDNTVSLVGTMFIDSLDHEISFLSTHVPVGNELQAETRSHLARLSSYIKNNCKNKPLLTLSGAKLASWTPEVRAFKNAHRLSNSHKAVGFSSNKRDEHIFYSKDLMCTEFSEIFEGNGVIATYQFKKSNTKTAQKLNTASSVVGTSL